MNDDVIFDDDDNQDDRPRRKKPTGNGVATAALVLGIMSLLFSVLTGIPAIICGIMGMSRAKLTGTGNGSAIAGLILGIVSFLLCPLIAILTGLMLPAVSKVREAASRVKDTNNYKQSLLATLNYESTNSEYPPAYYRDKGVTNQNLSWRVAVLKYSLEPNKYNLNFQYDQPWDSPANRSVSAQVIDFYSSSADQPATSETRVQGFVGPGTMFDPAVQRMRIQNITDGISNTVLIAEARNTVPWAAPRDMAYSPNGPLPALGHPSRPGFIVAMADGSVKFVRNTVPPEILRTYITRADGFVNQPLD